MKELSIVQHLSISLRRASASETMLANVKERSIAPTLSFHISSKHVIVTASTRILSQAIYNVCDSKEQIVLRNVFTKCNT